MLPKARLQIISYRDTPEVSQINGCYCADKFAADKMHEKAKFGFLMEQDIRFPSGSVQYIFDSSVESLWSTYDKQHTIIVTNDHIHRLHAHLFKDHRTLVLPPMESSKDLHTIESLAKDLLAAGASRNTMLVGVGGGVITDIVGYLGSVYMRGIPFGFVPTTLLGMVDAAIGGKNGVNLGLNKNILGTITQPKFILFDTGFLDTLPDDEWSNGFAEIIKYACIFDEQMFEELKRNSISYYRDKDDGALKDLIGRCVDWKNKTVQEDEKETGMRKLLNFGHTAAHAIENLYEIPHGKAVGIGIVIACMISEQVSGLAPGVTTDVQRLLSQYHLPVKMKIDATKAMEILRMDKKRKDGMIDYIVLERAGKAGVRTLPFTVIEKALQTYESNN